VGCGARKQVLDIPEEIRTNGFNKKAPPVKAVLYDKFNLCIR
jgi:hypothetical protein